MALDVLGRAKRLHLHAHAFLMSIDVSITAFVAMSMLSALRTTASRSSRFVVVGAPPSLALVAARRAAPSALCTHTRHLCKPPAPPDGASKAAAEEPAAAASTAAPSTPPAEEGASAVPPPPQEETGHALAAQNAAEGGTLDGALALQDHEGESLPPLAFEPGVAGAAQKGVSAIVIAFGAVAFGACAWGISLALFPGASSTQTIYSEAFEKIKLDPTISYGLGSPLRAHGVDRGGERGRRNEMERWDVEESGQELTSVRFAVSGPQGAGFVLVQTPTKRKRGEFKYIIFENRSCPTLKRRQLVHVLDTRADEAAEYERQAADAARAKAAELAKAKAEPAPAPAAA